MKQKKQEQEVEHHHVSIKLWNELRSIDIYLDHKKKEVQIIDSHEKSNRIKIEAGDWNELVNQIKTNQIGKLNI